MKNEFDQYIKEHKGLTYFLAGLEICAGLTVATSAHKAMKGLFKNNKCIAKHIGIPVLDFVIFDKTAEFVDSCLSGYIRAEIRYQQKKAAEKEQEEEVIDGESADGSEV